MIFNTHYPHIGGGVGKLNFEYTGQYTEIDDGQGNWRVKFLTSGTLTVKSKVTVDVFLVGAGGGCYTSGSSGSGGGGGYTKTVRKLTLEAGDYIITVGEGVVSADGSNTTAFNNTAHGGKAGTQYGAGGAGGSGGGSYISSDSAPFFPAGSGGSDGSNGTGSTDYPGGVGQGTTTREFGESGGELYSGGGAGSYPSGGGEPGTPGAGGGGSGRNHGVAATNGVANTGGGGGGGGNTSGGSGVVITRNAR